ncbi:methionine sulfoxide reductase A [Sphingomonas sp. Leaf407]|uniref:peptide-methionine (S)-S-oxide reductase MsrA n=1 Tax=unclassified Sphingomonas TaxID=196159 RepID=UPI0006F81F5A|nr:MULTISPECIES: peptide-methionine (S)-S-oxide reductase MsrA [unclassified Sphingomonas]KQN35676.1 methionine sulfoxide reductase A [Sphingomonas sp. Leaf42]KQT26543.1 methionine sulfoxide reductase A [Sphingomonas sp. Leaf407]
MHPLIPVSLVAAVLGGAVLTLSPAVATRAVPIPTVASDVPPTPGLATAVLAGGCFWGMEAVFEQVKGVKSVTSGYAGGTKATASYDQVSTERTGHAEAVRITYDPRIVSYGTLLRVYFSVAHDPTQVNGQMPDSGPSYRSAIFPQNGSQKLTAERYIAQLTRAKAFARPIATRIEGGAFYPAEAYHQDFARRNPSHPYIMRWDKPKIAAARAAYPGLVV